MLVGICQKYLQALIAEPLVTTVDFDRARIGPLRLTWEEVEGRASSKVLIGDLEPDNDRPPAVIPQTFLTCLFHVHPKLIRWERADPQVAAKPALQPALQDITAS